MAKKRVYDPEIMYWEKQRADSFKNKQGFSFCWSQNPSSVKEYGIFRTRTKRGRKR